MKIPLSDQNYFVTAAPKSAALMMMIGIDSLVFMNAASETTIIMTDKTILSIDWLCIAFSSGTHPA